MKIDRKHIHAKFGGHCAYCGKEITVKDMQVDHIYPKRLGGPDDLENLNPACRRCNHYKRGDTLEAFRRLMQGLHERIAKNYIVKVGLDYGVATLRPFSGLFYFETQGSALPTQLVIDSPVAFCSLKTCGYPECRRHYTRATDGALLKQFFCQIKM